MAYGQYEHSALTTAMTDETPRFADVERDLFPGGDVADHDTARDALEPWMLSITDRRMPVARRHARPG